ncbi:MAG TPA: copper resistance protein CopC [Gemmatimonadaceae bacterium]|nr:copper resistance protein CopC [Gemmatimonadaceae bacterium]
MRLRAIAFPILAVTLIGARALPFHLALQKSEPASKASLTQAPADLKLWFTESVELPLTKVALVRGNDTIALAALTQAKEAKSPIVAKINAPLAAGSYKVDWRAVGKDGHAVKGTFGFDVKAAASGKPGN